LSTLCDHLDALDFSATAANTARLRCAHLKNVSVRCGSLTDGLPKGEIDLVVFSEIGYYFTPNEWANISTALVIALPVGATVLAAHWLGVSADHLMSGDEVHEILRANPLLKLEQERRYKTFRLDRWERA